MCQTPEKYVTTHGKARSGFQQALQCDTESEICTLKRVSDETPQVSDTQSVSILQICVVKIIYRENEWICSKGKQNSQVERQKSMSVIIRRNSLQAIPTSRNHVSPMAHGRVSRSRVPSYAHLHRHAAAHLHESAAILVSHSTPDARLILAALLHPAHIQDDSGQNKHRRKNVDHIRARPTENVQDEYCQYSCTDKQYSKVIFEETFHHT